MIETKQATVYYSSKAGRRYFSLNAAIAAEARALITHKYPTEPFEPDTGHEFHWSSLDHAGALYERLCRMIKRSEKLGRALKVKEH